ncbi:hypothetical protein K0M31_018886 [Melipona bicolor]|uniref:Uncharacterized protein n=1 Tax=Melipona bicolor TaxID=60889 RepID=A0AA40KSC6_9HYME|nr:hypothetical protein K0M31_018886 [Melipona bicolor]
MYHTDALSIPPLPQFPSFQQVSTIRFSEHPPLDSSNLRTKTQTGRGCLGSNPTQTSSLTTHVVCKF